MAGASLIWNRTRAPRGAFLYNPLSGNWPKKGRNEMETLILLGSVLGIGFISGINLYATVLAIGLVLRFDLVQIDPAYEQLNILAHPAVIGAAGFMYVVEFFADKIPWVDSAWDTAHTFIRPVGAAALAAVAIGNLDPATEIALILVCGGVALSSHLTKAGTRVLVNHSPEPFSNAAVSVGEDVLTFGAAWLVLAHPLIALAMVVVFLALFIWLFPKLLRLLGASFRKVASLFGIGRKPAESTAPASSASS